MYTIRKHVVKCDNCGGKFDAKENGAWTCTCGCVSVTSEPTTLSWQAYIYTVTYGEAQKMSEHYSICKPDGKA